MFATMKPFARRRPPGAQPPPLWGDEAHVTSLLGDRVTDVRVERRSLTVDHFARPSDFREYFTTNYGPTAAIYRSLASDETRTAELDAALDDLAASFGTTTPDGRFVMEWEYLLLTARKR